MKSATLALACFLEMVPIGIILDRAIPQVSILLRIAAPAAAVLATLFIAAALARIWAGRPVPGWLYRGSVFTVSSALVTGGLLAGMKLAR